jgi:hypothetical protein
MIIAIVVIKNVQINIKVYTRADVVEVRVELLELRPPRPRVKR